MGPLSLWVKTPRFRPPETILLTRFLCRTQAGLVSPRHSSRLRIAFLVILGCCRGFNTMPRDGGRLTRSAGTVRRWSLLQGRDHNSLSRALDNRLQLILLRLWHPELVQCLVEITYEDLPFVRRDHEVAMRVPHRTTRVGVAGRQWPDTL